VPPKQRGKKQGKENVKSGDGFVSVAYDGGQKFAVPILTPRKIGIGWLICFGSIEPLLIPVHDFDASRQQATCLSIPVRMLFTVMTSVIV
jgi:hypothetical protein